MALPAHLLARLPAKILKNGLVRPADSLAPSGFGTPKPLIPEYEDPVRLLWEGRLPEASLVELVLPRAASTGVSLALKLCLSAQEQGRLSAYLDPGRSLFAPALQYLGLRLEDLLVLRPDPAQLASLSIKLAEARVFRWVIVDARGLPQEPADLAYPIWLRALRKLDLICAQSRTSLLLITPQDRKHSLPLPVHYRYEIHRQENEMLSIAVAKAPHGQTSAPRSFDPRGREPLQPSWSLAS